MHTGISLPPILSPLPLGHHAAQHQPVPMLWVQDLGSGAGVQCVHTYTKHSGMAALQAADMRLTEWNHHEACPNKLAADAVCRVWAVRWMAETSVNMQPSRSLHAVRESASLCTTCHCRGNSGAECCRLAMGQRACLCRCATYLMPGYRKYGLSHLADCGVPL